MTTSILTGLAEIADDYELFIVDLWGVVHDGEMVFPDVVDCMRRLRGQGARVVLLSNAARLGPTVARHLEKLGFMADLYDRLLTSGEVTAAAVAEAGPAYFHIGPERGRPTLAACGGQETDMADAEMIICTGLAADETEKPEDYRELLAEGVARGLTLVCANPDVMAIRGGRRIFGAGALAEIYEELGGAVRRYGKPFPGIFDQVFAEHPDIPRARAVMIGDGLATDIRGAGNAGIDALWIVGGVHAGALSLGPDGMLRPEKVRAVAEAAGERPMAVLPWLVW